MGANIDHITGTVTFRLGGVDVTLKCTWEAIAGIERDLKTGMIAIARRIALQEFGLMDLATILTHGMKAAGTEGGPTIEKVAAEIMKAGLLNQNLLVAVSLFCDFALTGGQDPKKPEAEADKS